MSQVVGLPNNSYKPITNTAWVRAWLCKLQKGCTRLAAASDKVYQLLAYGRWFSPASSTTKTGRHDIAEILLKVALNTNLKKNQFNSITSQEPNIYLVIIVWVHTIIPPHTHMHDSYLFSQQKVVGLNQFHGTISPFLEK